MGKEGGHINEVYCTAMLILHAACTTLLHAAILFGVGN